jgi:hypothetical protein
MKTHKKCISGLAAIGLALGFMQVSASALTITIDRVSGYYGGAGGEFTVTGSGLNGNYDAKALVTASNGQVGIETFCLEYGEFVQVPASYNASIGSGAVMGGPDHNSSGDGIDYISTGTALLYSEFASGDLYGYNYTPGSGRSASAAALQNAIWMLEDELAYSAGNFFLSLLGINNLAQFNASALRENNTNAGLGVRVLNLGTAPNYPNQDQLVIDYSSLSVPTVPDGGSTAMLLGTVLSGLALLKRKLG